MAAAQHGMTVARVPAYSPYAVAEHTVGLILSLNRKIHRAYARVREGNFALDGLLGFDLHGRTAGIMGTGQIGVCVARILAGFGCQLLACDPASNPEVEALGAKYVDWEQLITASDILTLHCPLVDTTQYLVNVEAIAHMRPGVMLINTSRGGLIDTRPVIDGLKSGQIGYLGMDVYEEEEKLFFRDHSTQVIQDDIFTRLLTFPNVLITAHQAFFTKEAMDRISMTTLDNIQRFEQGLPLANAMKLPSL